MVNKTTHEKYFQCPYCERYAGGHKIRVPRSIGKYRVKIIYDNILIFICSRCGRVFKVEFKPKLFLWDLMKKKEKEHFKKLKGGIIL